MTKQDTQKILSIIIASYPNYKPENLQVTLNVWHEMLKAFDYQVVQDGLKAYIMTDKSGFAPSIGQLVDYISKLTVESDTSEVDAWNMVRNAICDSTYHSQERFDELPEDVQRAVGSASQLRAWGSDMGYNEGVAQSNFFRVYRSVLAQKNERLKFSAIKSPLLEQTSKTELIEEKE